MRILWLFVCELLMCAWCRAEKVLGKENDEFDFDGLPGAQHEFKVQVGPGKEECFFQKIVAGGKLHVSFEVLRGGDTNIALFLLQLHDDFQYTVLQNTAQVARGGFQYGPFNDTGPYAICLDNSASRMTTKLVHLYLVSWVEEEWSLYRKEIESMQLTVANFTASIQNVQQSITDALVHQAASRMHIIKDWYLITGNNTYVQTWSICQCIVVILCTCIQVVFVRRLFKSTNLTPSFKPRA